METLIDQTCVVCGKPFTRRKAEVNRSQRLGRKAYCSLKCAGSQSVEHLRPYMGLMHEGMHANNRLDELSPFKAAMKHIRSHGKTFTITAEDIKAQWDKQQGICPYTGWLLKLPSSSGVQARLEKTPDRASLDRIDSSKGYTVDNIQFVALLYNYAKNGWSDADVKLFCEAVTSHLSA